MKSKDFEYVLAISEQQSFSKAAEQLYISQPSLSRYINALEKALGVKLFDRTVVPIELTYAGKRYLEYAKDIRTLEKKMMTEFENIKTYSIGKLDIGVPTQISFYILPHILPSFSTKYPNIELHIINGDTHMLSNMLSSGKLEVSVLSAPNTDYGIQNQIFAYDQVLIAAPPHHSLLKDIDIQNNTYENPTIIDLKMIEQEQFIVTERFFKSTVHRIFKANNINPKKILKVPDLNIALDLTCNGMGFSFIMKSMLKYHPTQHQPIFCSTKLQEEKMTYFLAYNKLCYEQNKILHTFVDYFKQLYPENIL